MTKDEGQAIWNALLSRSILAFCFVLCCVAQTLVAQGQSSGTEALRAELPASAEVQISNWRGGVEVEVWDEQYVSIRAKVAGRGPASKLSPVVIKRTERLLSIGVVNRTARNAARVDLIVRLPQKSRTRILTSDGRVEVRGMTASLSVQTVGGDIDALLSQNSDADVEAESLSKAISARLAPVSLRPQSADASARLYRARLGAGGRPARFHTERGQITLALSDAPVNETPALETSSTETLPATETPRRPPVLLGSPGNAVGTGGGAGTPAPDPSEPQELDEGDIVRVDTELVTVNMSVVDRSTNRGLAGLLQKDFRLYEDGAEQQLAHFDSSSAPFDLILLIDLSGSTREKVGLIRDAALRFINAARPSDRIGVITFAGSATLVSPPTIDREDLRRRVRSINTAQGDTKLYDALNFTMDQTQKETHNPRRTAIVLMSDGLDGTIPGVFGQHGSQITYREILSRINEFDGVLYVLWLNTEYEALSPEDTQPEAFDMGHDRMQEMAVSGGGLFYEVERLEDLAGAYERVVADLGTVYSLSYRPTNKVRDGRWRAIRINVARPNAVARGKRGYYAR
ncbi:MAG TPA: VWA domain-containing protein [Pyrinomonadaceae bacterium]